MTYQIIYSSQSTIPMQSDDLEVLLEQARRSNGIQHITGALIYSDGNFLQILEGERASVQALMARIVKDVRHAHVIVLREGEIPSARFDGWKMAYVSATPEQVSRWAGLAATGTHGVTDDTDGLQRTARFVQDILALIAPAEVGEAARARDGDARPGID